MHSSKVTVFSRLLLEWFGEHARQLPWRNVDNAYHILISEIILQQTRVSQGLSYYQAFVERFPTVYDLANAPLDAVMKIWQGLGYYTRARNLHAAARRIVEEYGGRVPDTYEELLKLPGLGPYAAGAVASFAYHRPVPAIDGNVYRVLARVYGIFDNPQSGAGKKVFRNVCLEVMDISRPHVFNQALLDFGALQCTPGLPDCAICPFPGLCYAEANALQGALPVKGRTMHLRKRYLHYFLIEHGDKTYIELRQGKDIWHSLYQFPLVETDAPEEPSALLERPETRELLGESYELLHVSEVKRQLLSHQELYMRFYIVRVAVLSYALLERYRCVDKDRVSDYQMPVTMGNYLAAEEVAEYFMDTPQGEEGG